MINSVPYIPTPRVVPTLRDLVYSIIIAIANHPAIKDPPVYQPTFTDLENREQVLIDYYRTYDGLELIEPGLTCAVFPAYSPHNFQSGFRSSLFNSVTYNPYTLGDKAQGFMYEVTYNLANAFYYRGVALLEEASIPFYKAGDKYTIISEDVPQIDYSARKQMHNYGIPQDDVIVIGINPAEEVIRDYLDLMRFVIDDIPQLLPWNVRSIEVKSCDYPTTAWNSQNENIYFHMAYMLVQLTLYSPAKVEQSTLINQIFIHNKKETTDI